MNFAAKVLQEQHLAIRPLSWARLTNTPRQWFIQGSLLLVVLSALATITVTSNTRHHYRQLQTYQQEMRHAEIERSRLLLEESTLLSHGRVAQLAESKAAMELPSQKMIVIL
ncbi:MAG: cell division protein FtsL [Gammaproteobacteria bacterium]|nr:cell division protein FtsL [Gammaproteobacteria bacterium]MCD8524773.1 cell division protein FtsL [Gammaproteobacteria bacterium]MCD8542164.1 cell division protein FtsL [Gammaproteobacteria bacterium]